MLAKMLLVCRVSACDRKKLVDDLHQIHRALPSMYWLCNSGVCSLLLVWLSCLCRNFPHYILLCTNSFTMLCHAMDPQIANLETDLEAEKTELEACLAEIESVKVNMRVVTHLTSREWSKQARIITIHGVKSSSVEVTDRRCQGSTLIANSFYNFCNMIMHLRVSNIWIVLNFQDWVWCWSYDPDMKKCISFKSQT